MASAGASKCPVMRLMMLLSSLLTTTTAFAIGPIRNCPVMSLLRGATAATSLKPLCPSAAGVSCRARGVPATQWTPHLPCRIRARPPSMRDAQSSDRSEGALGGSQGGDGTRGPGGGGGGGGGGGSGQIAVLGAGWVGSRLAARLVHEGEHVCVTNRPSTAAKPKNSYFQPVELPGVPRHEFDLSLPETWSSLPPPESLSTVIVTFACGTAPPPLLADFWESYLQHVPYVLCYSSTAVYRVDVPGQLVSEETPLRSTPRAIAESYLQERGATVLTISGIFGAPMEERGVCRCLASYASSGGALSGRKSVNMVHVDDIIEATLGCLAEGGTARYRGKRMNIGGHHFLLKDLIEHCSFPPVPEAADADLSSKRVLSHKLIEEGVLPEGYRFVEPLAKEADGSCGCCAPVERPVVASAA